MAHDEVARILSGPIDLQLAPDGSCRFTAGRLRTSARGRFWTMSVALGDRRDVAVHSEDQTPRIAHDAEGIRLHYSQLVTVDSDVIEADVTVTITPVEADGVVFRGFGEVGSGAIMQEIALPVLELDADSSADDEVLYRAEGLGRRIVDPRRTLKRAHTEYMVDDGAGSWESRAYPGELSMPWHGLQSGDGFLYMGRHDPTFHSVLLSSGVPWRGGPGELWLTTVTPSGRPEFDTRDVDVCLLDGDWRAGAERYRRWADAWYAGPREGARGLQGWQRIIMRHQHGAVQFRYGELVDLFEHGRRFGIDGILLFGWWKGGFDRGYPTYEPDDELGGAEELERAIRTIRERGGLVSLYANGNLIDRTTDYFAEHGAELTKKDRRGLDNVVGYDFAGESQSLRHFSSPSFVVACHGAPRWRRTMAEVAAVHASLGADSVFFDQTAYHLAAWPCFDESHEHGRETAHEIPYRTGTLLGVREAAGGATVGSEGMADAMISALDFHHGWGFAFQNEPEAFPGLFRTVFPEPVVSNRLLHDQRDGWRDQLNYAFFYNLVFDVAIHRGRLPISAYPEYAEVVAGLIALRRRHADHFRDGRFELVSDRGLAHARYRLDGQGDLEVYWNATAESVEENGVVIGSHAVAVAGGRR